MTLRSRAERLGLHSFSRKINYKYDALGRRIQRSTNGDLLNFVYDGQNVIQDLGDGGQVVTSYLNGPGIDNKVRQTDANGSLYYTTDHLGKFIDRSFQFWEYRVSHGCLLIRSPKGLETQTNMDLRFTGVEYVAIPRHFKGVELAEATEMELTELRNLLGKSFQRSRARVIISEGRRFAIVAASFSFSENKDDIFDSPFKP